MIRLIAVSLSLMLVGCSSATMSGRPTDVATVALPTGSAVPWESPYEVAADLCGRDGELLDRPRFGESIETRLEGEIDVVMRHGMFANRQNELFRIDVAGPSADAVNAYTDELRVCLDHLFAGGEAGEVRDGPREAADGSLPAFAEESDEDLLIEVTVVGFLDPETDPSEVETFVGDLVARPLQEWAGQLEERQASPTQADAADKPYLIDWTFDPTLKNGAAHQYVERSATQAWANVSVNAGRIKGGMCRGSSNWPIDRVNLGYAIAGVLALDTLSDAPGATYTYDLAFKGNSTGTYRVTGRWGYAKWYAPYGEDPPPPLGGTHTCYP